SCMLGAIMHTRPPPRSVERAPIRLERVGADPLPRRKRGEVGEVLRVELEAEHVDVLRDPLGMDRLRDRDETVLQVPPDEYLGGAAPVPRGDRRDDRVAEQRVRLLVPRSRRPAERTPRLDGDA